MPATTLNIAQMQQDIEALSKSLQPLPMEMYDEHLTKEQKELLNNTPVQAQVPNDRIPSLKMKLPPIKQGFKELMNFVEDGFKGNFKKLIEEAIKNAETEIKVSPVDPKNPKGKQQLEIKLQVASTLIQRYAGILSMALGKKSKPTTPAQPEEEAQSNEILKSAYAELDKAAKRIQLMELKCSILKLKPYCKAHPAPEASVGCFSQLLNCFSLFKKPDHALYHAILDWCSNDLINEPLSYEEMLGGILYIQNNLHNVQHASDRETLQQGLENLLEQHPFSATHDRHVEGLKEKAIHAFENRATDLRLNTPFSPQEEAHTSELRFASLSSLEANANSSSSSLSN